MKRSLSSRYVNAVFVSHQSFLYFYYIYFVRCSYMTFELLQYKLDITNTAGIIVSFYCLFCINLCFSGFHDKNRGLLEVLTYIFGG